MTTYLTVQIDYGAHAVSDSQPVVHAMRSDDPGYTMCGKRPLRYMAVPGQQVTCVKCLMAMPDEATMARSRHISTRTPKVVDVEKRRAYQRKWQEKQRRAAGAKPRVVPTPVTPELEQHLAETKGLGRCWVLTERGQALVDKWEQEANDPGGQGR